MVGKKLYFVVSGSNVTCLLTRDQARDLKTSDDILVEASIGDKQREKLQKQIDRLSLTTGVNS